MPAKINLVVRLQHWMDSVPGQTFLNYAYSWGAAIVILGALFKLTYLPGGHTLLFIGMGTEVVVFFLSAFDRPFDKTENGKELPLDYETDEEIARQMGIDDEEDNDENEAIVPTDGTAKTIGAPEHPGQTGTGTAVIGGSGTIVVGSVSAACTPATPATEGAAATATSTPNNTGSVSPAATTVTVGPTMDAAQLAEIIRTANDELLRRAQAVLSPDMEEATQTYIDKLHTLTETLAKVDEQSARLTRDSEEMENLNRTLTGINRIYELQLKGVSSQVGTIDQINEQTRRLAQQIEELNGVYGRMIKALTVNMKNAAGTTAAAE